MAIRNKKESATWNIHPGEMLREEFLKPIKMTHTSWPSASTSQRLASTISSSRGAALRRTRRSGFGASPEFWMNAHVFYEVRRAGAKLARGLERIEPRRAA